MDNVLCIWRYSFTNGCTTFKNHGIENDKNHPLYPCTKCDDDMMRVCDYYKPFRIFKEGEENAKKGCTKV